MAKKTISTLNIKVTSSAEGLQQGMRKSEGILDKFNTRIASMAAGFTAMTAAVIVARQAWEAFNWIVGKTMEQFGPLDEMQKMADNIGTTQENLIALEIAAGRSGASLEEMNVALKTLTRLSGEAAMGTGEAVAMFELLGLSADELNKMDAVGRFEAVARALSQIENEAEQAAIASKLLSEGGVNLLNTLRAVGESGLDPFIERANRLGLVLSREDLAQIEAFNDAWFDMELALRGVFTQLAGAIGPDLKSFVEEVLVPGALVVVEWVKAFKDLNDQMKILANFVNSLMRPLEVMFPRASAIGNFGLSPRIYGTQTQTLSPALINDPAGKKLLEDQLKASEETNSILVQMSRSLVRAYERGSTTVQELVIPSAG